MNDMIQNFNPFLGRLIVEPVEEDTQDYLKKLHGISEDSPLKNMVFAEATTDQEGKLRMLNKRGIVPLTKGKIVSIGNASFGDRFEKWYGKQAAEEGRSLKVGDIIKFVENQTFSLSHDQEQNYFLVNDDHILGYERVTSKELNKEIETNDR